VSVKEPEVKYGICDMNMRRKQRQCRYIFCLLFYLFNWIFL